MILINHIVKALSRLATIFSTKAVKAKQHIVALLSEKNNIEQMFYDIIYKHFLNDAKADQLNTLGIIVGQKRESIDAGNLFFFGFSGEPRARSFGDINDGSIGGVFRNGLDSINDVRLLTDEEYLKFIKSKIVKNNSNATREDIIAQIKFLFGTETQVVIDETRVDGTAAFTISIGGSLTINDKVAIVTTDIIMKPIGVKLGFGSEFNPTDFFGFASTPSAKSFGSHDDPNFGGTFANLISNNT